MATTCLFISNSCSPCLFSKRKQTLSSKSCLHDYPTAIPFSCSSSCSSTHKLHYFSTPKTSSLRRNGFHNILAPPVKGIGSSTLQPIQDEAPSAADIVDSFYAAINRKDVRLLKSLLAEDCILRCMFFFRPFEGKASVMTFIRDLMDSMDSELQFVIDETTEGSPHKVGEMWHLEQKQEKFFLGRGCSFHSCKNSGRKLLISDIQVFTDSPVKLDILAFAFLKVLRKVMEVLRKVMDVFPSLPTKMQRLNILFMLAFSLFVLYGLLLFIKEHLQILSSWFKS